MSQATKASGRVLAMRPTAAMRRYWSSSSSGSQPRSRIWSRACSQSDPRDLFIPPTPSSSPSCAPRSIPPPLPLVERILGRRPPEHVERLRHEVEVGRAAHPALAVEPVGGEAVGGEAVKNALHGATGGRARDYMQLLHALRCGVESRVDESGCWTEPRPPPEVVSLRHRETVSQLCGEDCLRVTHPRDDQPVAGSLPALEGHGDALGLQQHPRKPPKG